ncbi:MAG: hypothetical protein KJZ98_17710, partial [Burkholderiaceae bacterium]|nr:hypothetical protein [Burkholderiaceae bacterium]
VSGARTPFFRQVARVGRVGGMTETESKWAERIREWKSSGKGAEEFASGRAYKPSTLKWWATELRRRADGRQRATKPRAAKAIRLARVVRRTRAPAAGQAMVVEVSGARISVARGFDAELLADVVRALGGAR